MWNAGLDEAQAGIKIARRNFNNLRYADNTTLMAESEQELIKSLLMKVKEESEKVGTGFGATDWFQMRKRVGQSCILSPCLLTYMQSTLWEKLG